VVEIYALRWGVELFYRHFKQTGAIAPVPRISAEFASFSARVGLQSR